MAVPIILYFLSVHAPMIGIAAFVSSFLFSLAVVLTWPDGSFRERRHAIGLHRGKGFFREFGAGIIGYFAILPFAALGGLMGWTIHRLINLAAGDGGGDGGTDGHPIQDLFLDAPIAMRIGLLVLAAVAAPIIEETMFRGVLYRGLRRGWNVALSALVMGVVFAVVHPQGIAVLPALAGLGFGFGLIREWRDSLIGPMVAHALHNGTLVGMLWVIVL